MVIPICLCNVKVLSTYANSSHFFIFLLKSSVRFLIIIVKHASPLSKFFPHFWLQYFSCFFHVLYIYIFQVVESSKCMLYCDLYWRNNCPSIMPAQSNSIIFQFLYALRVLTNGGCNCTVSAKIYSHLHHTMCSENRTKYISK